VLAIGRTCARGPLCGILGCVRIVIRIGVHVALAEVFNVWVIVVNFTATIDSELPQGTCRRFVYVRFATVFRYNSCLCATVISIDSVLREWLRNCRLITSFYCFTLLFLHIPVSFLWSCIFRSCIFKCFIFFGPPFSGPAFSVDPFNGQKNKQNLSLSYRTQNMPGPAPTMYSECSRFHPNRSTVSGVIAERVNTAKPYPKVLPYVRMWPIEWRYCLWMTKKVTFAVTNLSNSCTSWNSTKFSNSASRVPSAEAELLAYFVVGSHIH